MLVAGWKCSLVDVHMFVSFTLWLCGCNLKCPFCHNWRVSDVDPAICRDIRVDAVIEELALSKMYIDYVHATGGEPLLQHVELRRLYVDAKSLGVKTSLNSNLTMPDRLRAIIDVLDHVATDAKVPHAMYGVNWWEKAYSRFLESVKLVGEHGIPLELRIPLARIDIGDYFRVIEDVVSRASKVYVIISKVLCEPIVKPRNDEWCKKYSLHAGEFSALARALIKYVESFGLKAYILHTLP